MGRRRRPVSRELRQARTRIERWRRTRRKRSPMPEPLWAAAVALAEREGVHHTARGLGLNYHSLRSRVSGGEAGAGARRRAAEVPHGFVELAPPLAPAAAVPAGPVLELVDRRGTRLTIRLPATSVVDLERLAGHLLEPGPR